MAEPTPRVVRFPRINKKSKKDQGDYVLVHTVSTKSEIELIGTEGNNVFAATVKWKDTSCLKHSNAVSQAQWDDIVSATLLDTVPEDGDLLRGIEGSAEVDRKSMTITFQRRVEGITSKYGEIKLLETEEQEALLFDWCAIAAGSQQDSRDEVALLRAALREKDVQIKKLETFNGELVELKKQNEAELLRKFSMLLNEKKLKIRDQQRLLASATIDPAKVDEVEESRASTSRIAKSSRKGKRKASQTTAEDSQNESENGFQKMDVDNLEEDSDKDPVQTPEPSETESEFEDSEPLAPPELRKPITKAAKAIPTKSPIPEPDTLPPKRQLPFAKKKPEPTPAPVHEDSETEDDDDEL